jgi:hypothetical protein
VIRSLLNGQVWLIAPPRTDGFADELRAELELRYEDEWWLKDLWLESVASDPRWEIIRNELWQIVHDLSKGAVIQIDP